MVVPGAAPLMSCRLKPAAQPMLAIPAENNPPIEVSPFGITRGKLFVLSKPDLNFLKQLFRNDRRDSQFNPLLLWPFISALVVSTKNNLPCVRRIRKHAVNNRSVPDGMFPSSVRRQRNSKLIGSPADLAKR